MEAWKVRITYPHPDTAHVRLDKHKFRNWLDEVMTNDPNLKMGFLSGNINSENFVMELECSSEALARAVDEKLSNEFKRIEFESVVSKSQTVIQTGMPEE